MLPYVHACGNYISSSLIAMLYTDLLHVTGLKDGMDSEAIIL